MVEKQVLGGEGLGWRAENPAGDCPEPSDFGAGLAQGLSPGVRRVQQLRALGVGVAQKFHSIWDCGRDRRGNAGGEDEGAGEVPEVRFERSPSAHEGSLESERLAERDDEHVGFDMIRCAKSAPSGSNHTDSVCLVDHEHAVELVGEGTQLSEWSEVPVHAEAGFDDEKAAAELLLRRLQDGTQCREVIVGEDADVRSGEPAPVDDGCVVQLVGEDQVFGTHERSDGSDVRSVARGEQQSPLHLKPLRDGLFSVPVHLGVAADEGGST